MPQKPTFNNFPLFSDMPSSFVCGPERQYIPVRHWPILAFVWPRCVKPVQITQFHWLGLNPLSWWCEASHWLLSNALMVHQLREPDSGNSTANALWFVAPQKISTHGLLDLESSFKSQAKHTNFSPSPSIHPLQIDLPQFFQAWSSKATNTKASPAADELGGLVMPFRDFPRAAVAAFKKRFNLIDWNWFYTLMELKTRF